MISTSASSTTGTSTSMSMGASVLQANPMNSDATNLTTDNHNNGNNAGSTGPNKGTSRVSDSRRSNKPIMEKRRRARINNCLNELKALILDAMKKDPARHSKLEKADILEMTVKHLQNLQRQQQTVPDPAAIGKFRAGFTECANEVGKFPGLETTVKRKLLLHLSNSLNHAMPELSSSQPQIHILPSPQRSPEQSVPNQGIILSNGTGTSIPLLPTRLPNGDIAFVLPASTTQNAATSPVPLLVPIMSEHSSSTVSEVSGSSYSPSQSPELMDAMYMGTPQQKPLSLVVRRQNPEEENGEGLPWRPW
ncbi:hypothetical protein ABEB36_011634 [Hypothenemus hampei]|uniref:Uncharacterized protein n=1 Tax=Hypothenemus hampei TaxID=57062 RepID=A0ABD1E9D4_HYPHA